MQSCDILQIDALASGLVNDPTVQVLVLKIDSPSRDLWAQSCLAATSYPYVAALPRDDASVYKLAHRVSSQEGLVRFMNNSFEREGLHLISPRAVQGVACQAVAEPVTIGAGMNLLRTLLHRCVPRFFSVKTGKTRLSQGAPLQAWLGQSKSRMYIRLSCLPLLAL